MAAGAYMGADQVQALIGKWYQIVGADVSVGPVGRGAYRQEHREERREEREARLARERAAMYAPPYVAPVVPVPYGVPAVEPVYGTPEWHRWHHHHRGGAPHATVTVRGDWKQIVGKDFEFPPRNALIEAPGPERGGREVLPMSTGVGIVAGQSAQITARPQRVAFRPERVFISASGTAGGASDWIVNDIKIGNRSQFSQSGDVPGDMFANNSIDSFVSFETAQTAMDVVLVVTYVGLNCLGAAFYGAIIGTAAI